MANVDVRIEGLDHLQQTLKQIPPAIARRIERESMRAAGNEVANEAKARIHSPHGHAAKGIKTNVTGSGMNVKAKISPSNRAAVFAQRSRGPGKAAPPPRAARAIVRQYGLDPEAAYPIARAIAKRGTTGHPVMRQALAAARPRIQQTFTTAIEGAIREAIR